MPSIINDWNMAKTAFRHEIKCLSERFVFMYRLHFACHYAFDTCRHCVAIQRNRPEGDITLGTDAN